MKKLSTSSKSTLEHKADVKNGVSRLILTGIAAIVEILFIVLIFAALSEFAEFIMIVSRVFGFILALAIYGQHKSSNIKTTWIIIILALPVLGVFLYLFTGMSGSTKKMRKRYEDIDQKLFPLLPDHNGVIRREEMVDRRLANISRFISDKAGFPPYANTQVTYYDDGLKGIEAQKRELKKAEKFIFMEYHAIEDAESWHGIQEILEDRVRAGVEVRLFYDDIGSIGFINTDFVNRMEDVGIKCRVFNPVSPAVNLFLNNRDHRKITVIDGKVGFTGGYNLANEYFHVTSPYGYWKDTGIKLAGDAVLSLTIMFLEMWNAIEIEDTPESAKKYLVREKAGSEGGFIQPYADSPMDDISTGEDVYISMVESATQYAWFITPYLIITDEMTHAFAMAAKRGVDVRIITPGVPDKKIIYGVTRSYYNGLAENGVKIYEFTPGFCHAKMCVVDDLMATCGTINMDYRSLYHHFENGCLLANCQAVYEIKKDFESVFAESRNVTNHYMDDRVWTTRFYQMILRLIAPLL